MDYLDLLKKCKKLEIKNKSLLKDNKILNESLLKFEDLENSLLKTISKFTIRQYKPTRFVKKPHKGKRSLVLHISDTHIGALINKDEVGNKNEFNEKIALKRFGYLFEQVINYKPHYKNETELVIVLNGDILAGVIHEQEFGVDLMTNQFITALNIFSQGFSLFCDNFNFIRVYCVVGNHGRFLHKNNKGRQMAKKWDSFESILYFSLKEVFKNYKNIYFEIPKTPYCLFNVQGHNFLATHGDTVINVGNVGKILKVDNISNQLLNIQVGIPKKIDVLLLGHVHVATYQVLKNGTSLLVNGTLSGLDEYAQSLGIFNNLLYQQLFEVTPAYKVGDLRFIDLNNCKSDLLKGLE